MKKLCYLAMAFMIVFAFVQAPAVQAESKITKIPLRYSDHIPGHVGGNVFIKNVYLPKIQGQLAKIGYELDITFYHSESLYKYSDQVQACDQGLIDATVAVMPYELFRAPLHETLGFGFMGWDGPTMNRVWAGLDKNIPEFRDELGKPFVEIFRFIPTRMLIHHNRKGARVPADFKGIKIHSSGANADMFKSIGAVPLRQNPGDWYTSLDRGLFDGIAVAFDMVAILKLYEVLKYHVLPAGDGFGFTPVTHLFNRKKFESLPAGVQQVILDNIAWASEIITLDERRVNLPKYQTGAREKGNTFYELTPEETEKWRAAFEPIHQAWIEKMEKKGLPGRKVYNEARRLVKEYMK
jgi:TRAP-type C4-dicarboxylate transport system substrate-binding protein